MDYEQLIVQQNAEVKRWSSMVTRKLRTSAARFQKGKEGMVKRKKPSPHDEAKLKDNLNYKIYKNYALAEGVGIKIERHGVFVQKGVGRGYISTGGVVTRGVKNSKEVKQYASAKNRAVNQKTVIGGSINRKPVDWFNSILNQHVPELADKIAKINADAVINRERILIK